MLRALAGLIRKEFTQVRRDRNMLRIIFGMPIIQLLLLGYAVNLDVERISLDVYDFNQSQESRELVQAMGAGEYFLPDGNALTNYPQPLWELESRFKAGEAEMAVIIPEDFSTQLIRHNRATISLLVDGADANQARTGLGYAAQIIGQYSREQLNLTQPVELRHETRYNPESESIYFMVPGIVVTLLTMVTVMITSMAIVRERETGTLEQLMVTPISGTTLLLGKITTFGILGFVEMIIALVVGVLWFEIPFVGSPLLLFALAALYLITTLGMGMFFSTVTSTQQQAMFLAWFFMIFAILTSGFFTPISNMPEIIQHVTYLNPMRYFMTVVRGIMMKGAGFFDLLPQIAAMAIYGIVIFGFSMMRFQKRVS